MAAARLLIIAANSAPLARAGDGAPLVKAANALQALLPIGLIRELRPDAGDDLATSVTNLRGLCDTLEQRAERYKDELDFIVHVLGHQDQDANHAWMVRRIRAVLAGRDPATATPWLESDGLPRPRQPAQPVVDMAQMRRLKMQLVRLWLQEDPTEPAGSIDDERIGHMLDRMSLGDTSLAADRRPGDPTARHVSAWMRQNNLVDAADEVDHVFFGQPRPRQEVRSVVTGQLLGHVVDPECAKGNHVTRAAGQPCPSCGAVAPRPEDAAVQRDGQAPYLDRTAAGAGLAPQDPLPPPSKSCGWCKGNPIGWCMVCQSKPTTPAQYADDPATDAQHDVSAGASSLAGHACQYCGALWPDKSTKACDGWLGSHRWRKV